MTTQTAVNGFQSGYQAALTDVAAAYQRDGLEGILQWLDDNLQGDDYKRTTQTEGN